METIQHTKPVSRLAENKKAAHYLFRAFNRQAEQYESARFGWMAILLTFQSCLGAVACMYISEAKASVVLLAACAAITMGSNALFIAQASGKVCLFGFYVSVILNTILLLMTI